MIILLLDANRTVNGVITGVFSGPPLPPAVNSGLSRCTLSDSLGWRHPRVLGSQERGCASLDIQGMKVVGCSGSGQ